MQLIEIEGVLINPAYVVSIMRNTSSSEPVVATEDIQCTVFMTNGHNFDLDLPPQTVAQILTEPQTHDVNWWGMP